MGALSVTRDLPAFALAPTWGKRGARVIAVPADELFDPRRGDFDVLIFPQTDLNEVIQNGIAELLPPGGVGNLLRLLSSNRQEGGDLTGGRW